ncbi:MAG TPA: class I SAM-dependent methyltransferase [Verrucomicrobiae bacterium]|nr:class I SAM-dependent methyltransferase [Verrucomicrobiae bacterium]
MKRFGYVFDPLFLFCCALYATNRWLIKPHCDIAFFHNWFNDVLLIPCALPPLLLAHRWLRLRKYDQPPTLGEVTAHVIGWSILFEVIGPHIMPTVGDPWDAVSYACGGFAAFFCWQKCYARGDGGRADFDRLAPHYGWMERLLAGRKLQRCRAAFLQAIPPPRRALVAGQGHGAFVAELLRAHPHLRCTCVDSSSAMLHAARANLRHGGVDESRAEFIHADLMDWVAPDGEFDLIVTHFFLDCFRPEQLECLLPKLSNAATPNACWLLADFREPPAGPARWRARAIIETMYVFFRWATALPASQLTPPDPLMAREGFTLGQRRTFDWGLLHSDLWIRGGTIPAGETAPTRSDQELTWTVMTISS